MRASGTITIGYRESSIPFSYLSARDEPIGYSIDLCKLLVDAISEEVGRTIAIKWLPVTPETRIDAVASGQVDLECGSTTSNLERQKRVSFSPTIFVSGTKLLVKKGSPIRSFRDLAGKKVAVTAGTTNEKTLRDLAAKFKLDMQLEVAPDHAASFALLAERRRSTPSRPTTCCCTASSRRTRRRASTSSSATSSPTIRTASCFARTTRSSRRW